MHKMKNRDEIINHVFTLWDTEGMTYAEISKLQLPSFLSLDRIRTIIYSRENNTPHAAEIIRLFHVKFQELQSVDAAIKFVYENQPDRNYSERSIKRFVTIALQQKQKRQLNTH